jgi:hypothetical protein
MSGWRPSTGRGTLLALAILIACGGDAVTAPENLGGEEGSGSDGSGSVSIPAMYAKFESEVEVSTDGNLVVLRSNDVPDHGSPYFDLSDPRYEAYDGNNPQFNLNPNRIREQQLTLRVPADPSEASVHETTPLGVIGLAVNGVAIFNQYAGFAQPLTREVDTFDQYNGHPQQTGVYHYHVEPLWLTRDDPTALVGVLLDGFPVYGPEEDGRRLTNTDLDAYHGHFGPTADFSDGIYHYHVTDEDPYINGSGFFGVAGTVSQ